MFRNGMAVCVVCGCELQRKATGRRPLYCSGACRQRAYRRRLEERVWRGGTLGPAEAAEVARLLDSVFDPARR